MIENNDMAKDELINEFVRKWSPQQDHIEKQMKIELGQLIDVYKKNEIDPKYLNIPNIQFSLTTIDDDREIPFREQRITRGFDDSETWSLRNTIADFILPRLKRHREIIENKILNTGRLYENIDLSIRAFEIVKKENTGEVTKKEWREYDKGMKAFHQVFMRLWW